VIAKAAEPLLARAAAGLRAVHNALAKVQIDNLPAATATAPQLAFRDRERARARLAWNHGASARARAALASLEGAGAGSAASHLAIPKRVNTAAGLDAATTAAFAEAQAVVSEIKACVAAGTISSPDPRLPRSGSTGLWGKPGPRALLCEAVVLSRRGRLLRVSIVLRGILRAVVSFAPAKIAANVADECDRDHGGAVCAGLPVPRFVTVLKESEPDLPLADGFSASSVGSNATVRAAEAAPRSAYATFRAVTVAAQARLEALVSCADGVEGRRLSAPASSVSVGSVRAGEKRKRGGAAEHNDADDGCASTHHGGEAALCSLMVWLCAYRGLFETPCKACGRLLAPGPDGTLLPPTVRTAGALRMPLHAGCCPPALRWRRP
jgi:hypothetical protein